MKKESLEEYLNRGGEIKKVPRTYENMLISQNNIKQASFKNKEARSSFVNNKIKRKAK